MTIQNSYEQYKTILDDYTNNHKISRIRKTEIILSDIVTLRDKIIKSDKDKWRSNTERVILEEMIKKLTVLVNNVHDNLDILLNEIEQRGEIKNFDRSKDEGKLDDFKEE